MMQNVMWLKDIRMSDIELVGGKNASLGEMMGNLSKRGINIPNGFAITTHTFAEFLHHNNLEATIKLLLNEIQIHQTEEDLICLRRNGLQMRSLIQNGAFPAYIEKDIIDNYTCLSGQYKDAFGIPQLVTDVAVRSSSTAEDLQDASFAGQQETYLNVRGKYQLLESIKNCFASLYTDRAIAYVKNLRFFS